MLLHINDVGFPPLPSIPGTILVIPPSSPFPLCSVFAQFVGHQMGVYDRVQTLLGENATLKVRRTLLPSPHPIPQFLQLLRKVAMCIVCALAMSAFQGHNAPVTVSMVPLCAQI